MVNGSPIFVMYVVRYRNQKEKVSEEVVAIPSTYDVETTMNDFKKKAKQV